LVVAHLRVVGPAPRGFVRPFGVGDETPVRVLVQARAVAAVLLRDQLGPAAPGLAELLLLARVDPPPVDGHEHDTSSCRRAASASRCDSIRCPRGTNYKAL